MATTGVGAAEVGVDLSRIVKVGDGGRVGATHVFGIDVGYTGLTFLSFSSSVQTSTSVKKTIRIMKLVMLVVVLDSFKASLARR